MSNNQSEIGWIEAQGSHRDIGLALGKRGYEAVHQHLTSHPLWKTLNESRFSKRVIQYSELTKAHFPYIWEEIEGLAEGLELPVNEVMAWNCRGDLLSSSPDGCTTVQAPGDITTIAHNEDGFPFLRGSCFVVKALPLKSLGFWSFCYPGSIAGHTFSLNHAGLVQTINNLRLVGVATGIPRMVLTRAILSVSTLKEALNILTKYPASGGFHVTLAQAGERQLYSVEFGGERVSVKEIKVPAVHTNHALHLESAMDNQIITDSSRDRQRRGDELIAQQNISPIEILRDTNGNGLPIRRDMPDDPDCENTLATAVFNLSSSGVEWSIYDKASGSPAYQGE